MDAPFTTSCVSGYLQEPGSTNSASYKPIISFLPSGQSECVRVKLKMLSGSFRYIRQSGRSWYAVRRNNHRTSFQNWPREGQMASAPGTHQSDTQSFAGVFWV